MGATFARLKNWTVDQENLTDEELNAEFNNILDNLTPSGIDDHSASLAQMKTQTTPGAQGTESQATSLAGELERLRFVISRAVGKTYWYDSPSVTLEQANTLLTSGSEVPQTRIASGRIDSNRQSMFLIPGNSSLSLTVNCATTNLSCYIDGALTNFSANITLSGLSAAPTTNNTATLNDATLNGQVWTKLKGEYGSSLTIASAGTEITSRIGKFAAFKLTNSGAETEYFTAFVESATSLTRVRRGYFFNSADSAIPRVVASNGNTITLMKLTWVFVNTSGVAEVTYNPPTYSKDEPSGASIGDYWYDLANDTWKKYSGSAWSAANAIFIGTVISDGTNTVAARSEDVYANYKDTNTLIVERISNTEVRASRGGQKISVAGNLHSFGPNFRPIWDITLDRRSGVSESLSTTYYIYITDQGDKILDTIAPYDRLSDMYGHYHPHAPWRCVGAVFNDGSSNFDTKIWNDIDNRPEEAGNTQDTFRTATTPGFLLANSSTAITLPRDQFFRLYTAIGIAWGNGDGSTTFTLPNPSGRFPRYTDSGITNDPDRASRTAYATGGNTGDTVGSVQGEELKSHVHGEQFHAAGGGAGTGIAGDAAVQTPFPATDLNTLATGGNETRPKNFNVNMLVKT